MPAAKRREGGRQAADARPVPPAAAADRVGEERAEGTPPRLRADLVRLLGEEKVFGRITDLVAYASDASPYRFVPQAVVAPDSVQDMVKLMAYARAERRHLVFRAAGTSLAGQAQGEDILVDVRRHFSGVEIEAGGARARVLTGTVLARADAALARRGRVLGPDPASAAAATVGGVIATNAAGPAAGRDRDAYRTVASLTVVLASGTVVDTGDPDADAALAAAEPELCQGLLDLRDEIEADAELTARIRAKCAVRGPAGYRLDAFLDGETPVQILRGLMIGSQGTLGFVAEAVWTTFPLRPAVSAALLCFPSLPAAAGAAPLLTQSGADVVDLLTPWPPVVGGGTGTAGGGAAGDAGRGGSGAPSSPGGEPLAGAGAADASGAGRGGAEAPPPAGGGVGEGAALLVEFRAADEVELAAYERAARRICDDLGLVAPVPPADNAFTRDPRRVARYRSLRDAARDAAAANRPAGATLFTTAVAVPPDRLAEACAELLAVQRRHGLDAAPTGHAAHGGLCVRLPLDPAQPAGVERWAAFCDDLATAFAERFDGCCSLAAEYGAGRAGAPFLEREWGARATAVMWRVKALLDPDGILAPRVVLDHDPRGHLRGLKRLPVTGTAADACTECGLCEPVCPSRDVTTTPRQRIVLRREMARQPAGSPVLRALTRAYGHDAVDTCAGDGLCRPACPFGIDTGALMARDRAERRTRARDRAAIALAVHARVTERAARAALGAAGAVAAMRGAARPRGEGRASVGSPDAPAGERAPAGARRRASLSVRFADLPGVAPRLPRTTRDGATAVYYPSCAHRVLGGAPFGGGRRDRGARWTPRALVTVSARAGLPVWIPPDVAGTCCGGAWRSHGCAGGAEAAADRLVERAWLWTGGGRLPIVVDSAGCALGFSHEMVPYLSDAGRELHGELTVIDAAVWAADHVLPRLVVTAPAGSAVLHPTCAMRHLGTLEAFETVARACAGEVVTPDDAGCCGCGADRGMRPGEVSRAATRREAEEVAGRAYDLHLSGDGPCELALTRATGEPYESFIVALERVSRPPEGP